MVKKVITSTFKEEDSKYMLNEEVLELKYHAIIKNLKVPEKWWNSSNSFSFYGNNEKDKIKLFKITEKEKDTIHKITEPSENPMFDASKGDYIITNSNYLKKDYTHYRKSKERIIKYSIYPAIFFSLLVTLIILNFIIKF